MGNVADSHPQLLYPRKHIVRKADFYQSYYFDPELPISSSDTVAPLIHRKERSF